MLELLLALMGAYHLYVSPYSKVEESFNLQAIHDLFFYGPNLTQYDHLEFPGVVPRTFLGPLVISLLAAPYAYFLSYIGARKFLIQIVVRSILGALVLAAFQKYRQSVQKRFGMSVGMWLVVITASQFHFIYYSSRTLPNIFALALVLYAYHCWLEQKLSRFISASAAAIILFRSELALLLGTIFLYEIASHRLKLTSAFKYCALSGILSLGLTVVIDSYFWKRWLWPEGEVFWYNTYLNKSADWGTSPFLWYFYSAIPRAMASSFFFLPLGIILDRRIRVIVFPAFAFVIMYSFLPHKELRFIIYVFPLLNVAVAQACHQLWILYQKTSFKSFVALILCAHLAINISVTSILLYISHLNYPGGTALELLHKIESSHSDVHLHIDVYSAQTGITRFLELNSNWKYNKTENLKPLGPEMMSFTHLLVEAKNKYSPNIKPYWETHDILAIVKSFSHVSFNYKNFPPMQVRTKPSIFILKRKASFVETPIYKPMEVKDY